MARAFSLILAGAIAGSAAIGAVFAVVGSGAGPPGTLSTLDAASTAAETGAAARSPSPRAAPPPEARAPQLFDTHFDAHVLAATASDAGTLESLIGETAAQPNSARRDAELGALLEQLAAIDPRGAARLAASLELEARMLGAAFKAYADADADGALAELGGLRPYETQMAVALELLEVFGVDPAGIDRVAATFALPAEALAFRVDAAAEFARHDLPAALEWTRRAETSQLETVSQQRIATEMARVDPYRGLEHAASIPIAIQRRRYMDRLFDEWAKVDPEAMLAYLETADLTEMALTERSYRAVAAAAPERLLAIVERFAPAQRVAAQQAAFDILASLDPADAYNRVSALPATGDRNQLIQTIAQRYADQDPDGALLWARSLEPRSNVAFDTVLAGIAASDPARAADVVIAEIVDPAAADRGEMPTMAQVLSRAIQAKSPEVARIADKLASHTDPRVRSQLDTMLALWPQVDASAALDWAMRNTVSLRPDSIARLAQQVATQDPDLARRTLERLPGNLRSQWIASAAPGIAQTDFAGALSWLADIRNDPAYENALEMTLQIGARTQPQAAASYLDGDPAVRAQLAPTVASAWASQDPGAAARWLSGLSGLDEQQRAGASSIVASQWARRDLPSATQWVLEMPSGLARDLSLTGMIPQAASTGSIDARLLNAFSTPDTRSQALLMTVPGIGRTNPELARRLIAQHISDPAMRAQAEQRMQAQSGAPLTFINRPTFRVAP